MACVTRDINELTALILDSHMGSRILNPYARCPEPLGSAPPCTSRTSIFEVGVDVYGEIGGNAGAIRGKEEGVRPMVTDRVDPRAFERTIQPKFP